MTVPALEFAGVSKRWGDAQILDGVSLAVEEGSCHVLVGPNGAGKSTLLDIASGRSRADAGTVTLFGTPVAGLPPSVILRRGLARSFQRTQLFNSLSVLDNLRCAAMGTLGHAFAMTRTLDGFSDVNDRAEHLLEQIGLARRRAHPADSLPYAERRLLDLGLALASDARVMLLDEPASGLGTAETRTLQALLSTLKRERTLLVVEHDLDLAFGLADRVSVLVAGRVLASGPADAVRLDQRVSDAYMAKATAA